MRKFLLAAALIAVPCAVFAGNTDVTQSHTSFDNDEISVKAGDTITFINKDDVTHNIQVTDASGANEDKGLQKPGENIKETFAKAGDKSPLRHSSENEDEGHGSITTGASPARL